MAEDDEDSAYNKKAPEISSIKNWATSSADQQHHKALNRADPGDV